MFFLSLNQTRISECKQQQELKYEMLKKKAHKMSGQFSSPMSKKYNVIVEKTGLLSIMLLLYMPNGETLAP